MRKIIGAIFGSSKNTETIVNGAVKGLDSMFFTKEEQAEYRQKGAEWFLEYLKATQPQNLARRLIALMVVFLWSILILLGVGVRPWADEYATYIFQILADVVMTPFLMIMGFYFAAHVVRSFADGKKQ